MVTLQEEKDFTVPGLLKYLNQRFSSAIRNKKKHGFTLNDVHQYILKQKLPDYCGNIKLQRFDNDKIGLTWIRLIKNATN